MKSFEWSSSDWSTITLPDTIKVSIRAFLLLLMLPGGQASGTRQERPSARRCCYAGHRLLLSIRSKISEILIDNSYNFDNYVVPTACTVFADIPLSKSEQVASEEEQPSAPKEPEQPSTQDKEQLLLLKQELLQMQGGPVPYSLPERFSILQNTPMVYHCCSFNLHNDILVGRCV